MLGKKEAKKSEKYIRCKESERSKKNWKLRGKNKEKDGEKKGQEKNIKRRSR